MKLKKITSKFIAENQLFAKIQNRKNLKTHLPKGKSSCDTYLDNSKSRLRIKNLRTFSSTKSIWELFFSLSENCSGEFLQASDSRTSSPTCSRSSELCPKRKAITANRTITLFTLHSSLSLFAKPFLRQCLWRDVSCSACHPRCKLCFRR